MSRDWGGYGRAPMNPGDMQRLCAKVALFDWSMGLRGESIRRGDESLALFGASVAAKLPAHSDGRRKGRRRYGYRAFPSQAYRRATFWNLRPPQIDPRDVHG